MVLDEYDPIVIFSQSDSSSSCCPYLYPPGEWLESTHFPYPRQNPNNEMKMRMPKVIVFFLGRPYCHTCGDRQFWRHDDYEFVELWVEKSAQIPPSEILNERIQSRVMHFQFSNCYSINPLWYEKCNEDPTSDCCRLLIIIWATIHIDEIVLKGGILCCM